jgi:signal transduction histidine kinase
MISVKSRREHYNDDNNDNCHENAVVTIKDTGSGISPDIFPRLFTKFATNSNSGTGWGYLFTRIVLKLTMVEFRSRIIKVKAVLVLASAYQ